MGIALDTNKTELESDPSMSLEHIEEHFKGVYNLITTPINRIFAIQKRTILTKRTEAMKEFKIVGVLGHVMTDVPERLIHVNHISSNLMHYVLLKAWPLT